MQKTKRLFAMLMVIAMMLTLLPVMASAKTMTGGEVLYLTPNSNWKVDNARFAAYFFGNGEAWASATAVEGETDLYQVTVPSGNWTNVIFCRMNPGASANNWNNKWNQTSDLTYDGTNNHYTVKSGTWDKGGGTWSVYTPPVVEPETSEPSSEPTTAPTEPPVDPRNITIHYRNIHLWDTINAHAWIPASNSVLTGEWPGTVVPAASDATNWYTLTLEQVQSESIGVLFNHGADQTSDFIISDIPAENAEYWIDETVKAEDGTVSIQTTAPEDVWPDGSIEFDPTLTPVYLKPNANWKEANARFAMHCFVEGGSNAWYDLADSDADGIYEGVVPEIYTTIIFCRMNPATTENNWDNKWNQTADLSVPTDDNNCYSITESSWDSGSWGILPPPQQTEEQEATIHFCNSKNWEIVNIYAWTNTLPNTSYPLGEWPGTAIEIDDNGFYTCTINATVPVGENINFIINNGSGSQTVDLSIANGQELWIQPTTEITNDDGTLSGKFNCETATSADGLVISPVVGDGYVTINYKNEYAESVEVYGSMNNWSKGYEMKENETTNIWSVTLNLVGEYQYKLVVKYADNEEYQWINDPANNSIAESGNNLFTVTSGNVAQVGEIVYTSVAEAVAAANGETVKLLLTNQESITIDANLSLDLNGCTMGTINVAEGAALTLIDTATDDYAGNCGYVQVSGTVNTVDNYLLVSDENNVYSAHRYDVQITHISLDPNSDALGYKATVQGDSAVQAAVTGFGFELSVAGGQTKTFTAEPGENFDGTFTLRLKNILACGGGEMEITASAFVIFGEERSWDSQEQTTTMKETLQAVDAAWDTAGYTQDQKDAVKALCNKYYEDTQNWNLDNIFPTIDIPITQ